MRKAAWIVSSAATLIPNVRRVNFLLIFGATTVTTATTLSVLNKLVDNAGMAFGAMPIYAVVLFQSGSGRFIVFGETGFVEQVCFV